MVQEAGGYESVCQNDRWRYIAYDCMALKVNVNKCYGAVLRGHYEKFLYPYDLFESGASTNPNVSTAAHR